MMNDKKENSKAIYCAFIGKAANAQIAERKQANMVECPYVSFYEVKENHIFALFVIPEHHRWWLTMLVEQPDLLGLEAVRISFIEEMIHEGPSSQWSRGESEPTLNLTPCGCFCPECTQYQKNCEGCPSSSAYTCQSNS